MKGNGSALADQGLGSWVARYWRAQKALLLFRPSPIDREGRWTFLSFALGMTWLAGMGRYWDHPSAAWWQYAGWGSVGYVFALSALLWLVGLPLRMRGWGYVNLLLFVCMTSAPALLYAIPVERFLPLPVAQDVNFWFLAIVASWRVGLLLRFLAVPCGLGAGGCIVALLPLCVILLGLSAFNLEHATFEIMASGERRETPHDGAYAAVVLLSGIAAVGAAPLVLTYLVMIADRHIGKGANRGRKGEVPQ